MRLRTDIWVSALCRRAQSAGAFVYVGRRGAAEAGAVFVAVLRRDGALDLYGPAPQAAFDTAAPEERLFTPLLRGAEPQAVTARMEREQRFDSDLWLVEIEDRDGRPFVDIVDELPPFTGR